MSEILWKTLIYNGELFERFEVSTDGQIRNAKTVRIYKTHINHEGYEQVCVSLGSRNKKKVFKIHKAIAETFIPNLDNKPVVNHKDGNKQNNYVANLEWTTTSENIKHVYDFGLKKPLCGIDNPASKLSTSDIFYIREHYVPRDSNFGARALGRKFEVAHSVILDIINRRTYVNV